MKISELIALLEQCKEEYGDADVCLMDVYCDMYDVTRVVLAPSSDTDILIL